MKSLFVFDGLGRLPGLVQFTRVRPQLFQQSIHQCAEYEEFAALDRAVDAVDADFDFGLVRFAHRQAACGELLAPLALGLRAADYGRKRWFASLDFGRVLGGGAAPGLVFAVSVEVVGVWVFGEEDGSGVDAAEVEADMPPPVRGNREARYLVVGVVETVVDQADRLGELAVELLMKLPRRQLAATAFVLVHGEGGVHRG